LTMVGVAAGAEVAVVVGAIPVEVAVAAGNAG
jgi:hypothetical protein